MANAKEWVSLSIVEKRVMNNKLIHLVSNSSHAFKAAENLLKAAEELGIFNGCNFDIGTIIEDPEQKEDSEVELLF